MLTALSIRDVVLIEALDLEFGAGLGVLTGETGAGKSILLDALGLTLGARGEIGLVRQGAVQAVVTASFESPPCDSGVANLMAENGLDLDPGEPLLIRRIVKSDGGSRAFVNDQPASAGLLRELAAHLVEIHGQHDDRGLLNPRGHRALLDAFARADAGPVAIAHRAWREAQDALAVARAEYDLAERDREWLEHAVAELRALAPEPGEEQRLAERRAAMQRGEKITGDLQGVADLLEGSDGGLSRLRQAARILDRVGGDHPALAEALAAVDRAITEGSEAQVLVDAAADALAFDPAALESDETRLFELRGVARKHRVQPDDLAALAEELTGRLDRIESGGSEIARLELAVEEAHRSYRDAARALSAARIDAATRLDLAVAAELAPLKLDAARFRTAVEPLGEEQWGPVGMDPHRVPRLDQPGRPLRAADQDRFGGRAVALHPRAQGRAGGGGWRAHADLRRDRSRRRRRGRQRDRRAIGAAGDDRAGAGGDAQPPGRGARRHAPADRQAPRRPGHPHRRPPAR